MNGSHIKMLYDKQEGCFKEFDDKRYLIVGVSKYDKLYIHHDKDGVFIRTLLVLSSLNH